MDSGYLILLSLVFGSIYAALYQQMTWLREDIRELKEKRYADAKERHALESRIVVLETKIDRAK